MQLSLTTLDDHMTLIEQRVSRNEDTISNLQKRVKDLEKQDNYLTDKVEDLKNHSRSSNLWFLNVPECAEGRDMLGFIQQLIPQFLGKMNFPSPTVIERAHRTGTTHREGIRVSGPRPILEKLLNFQDKLKILRLAWENRNLSFKGLKVYIYPDFSDRVLDKRQLFDTVKKKLCELDIKYSLQRPTLLRVIHDGTSTLYRTPTAVDAVLVTPWWGTSCLGFLSCEFHVLFWKVTLLSFQVTCPSSCVPGLTSPLILDCFHLCSPSSCV